MNSELISRKQIAAHFGVVIKTVENWDKKGLIIPSFTINGRPRYNKEDVLNALVKKKGGPTCK